MHLNKYLIAFSIQLLIGGHALHAKPCAYIGNTSVSNINVINVATNKVIATVSLDDYIELYHTRLILPYNGIDLTPDNHTLYVACYDTDTDAGLVKLIDATTNTLLPTIIPIASAIQPISLAMAPNGLYGYVTCDDSTVRRINVSTNEIDVIIPLASFLHTIDEISISTDSRTAYVTGGGLAPLHLGYIMPIDLVTNTLGTPVFVGFPYASVPSPDGKYLYVANGDTGSVVQLNLANPLAPTISNTIPIGSGEILAVALTPDGNYLYATNTTAFTITPVNISNPRAPIVGPTMASREQYPWGIAATPDGNFMYITNYGTVNPPTPVAGDTVTPLNITNRFAPVSGPGIIVDRYPLAIVITYIQPPTKVTGTFHKNIFLDKTELIVSATWTPSTSPNVVAYNIYRNNILVQTISANCPSAATILLCSCDEKNLCTVSAINRDGLESMRIPVKIE